MLCQNCGRNEANVKYTQIINGVKKEVMLCHECAMKLGIDSIAMPDFPINFKSFLGDFFNDYQENELMPSLTNKVTKCKNCNMTYDDFIKTGMFGCEECYDTFSNPIDALLKNLHGTARHIGRIPGAKASKIKIDDENSKDSENNSNEASNKNAKNEPESKKEKLQAELEKAIKEERYEDAAKIRDELKEIEK